MYIKDILPIIFFITIICISNTVKPNRKYYTSRKYACLTGEYEKFTFVESVKGLDQHTQNNSYTQKYHSLIKKNNNKQQHTIPGLYEYCSHTLLRYDRFSPFRYA